MFPITIIISDHFVIPITISMNNVHVAKRSISYRNTSSINIANFISNLRSSICINNVCTSTHCVNNSLLYTMEIVMKLQVGCQFNS